MAKWIQVQVASPGELWRHEGMFYVCTEEGMRCLLSGGDEREMRDFLSQKLISANPLWLSHLLPQISLSSVAIDANEAKHDHDGWTYIADDWVKYISDEVERRINEFRQAIEAAQGAMIVFGALAQLDRATDFNRSAFRET